jgi:hypothetical protein
MRLCFSHLRRFVACLMALLKHQSNLHIVSYMLIAFSPWLCTLASHGILPRPFSVLMSSFLDRLPFDILFYISSNLHLDDVVQLGQTCRQLQVLLNERTLQRCVVEVRTFTSRRSVDVLTQIADLSTCPGDSARSYWSYDIRRSSSSNLRQTACTIQGNAVLSPNSGSRKYLPISSGCDMHTIW